jgi:hypothetical protein
MWVQDPRFSPQSSLRLLTNVLHGKLSTWYDIEVIELSKRIIEDNHADILMIKFMNVIDNLNA